ncbi:MAG: response regulator [Candidatus Diapherotrites archaeon]|nr:response regulator [Candidatus Diapherotrites archaeon]
MKKKVLIVDDEKDILISVKQLVERDGFEAKTAASCKEAMNLLEKEKFDLVLMDIFMPEQSGRDCVEKIRKTPKIKNQKIAFLTVAHLSELGKKIIEDLKPVDFIQKPINIDDFSKRMKKILK